MDGYIGVLIRPKKGKMKKLLLSLLFLFGVQQVTVASHKQQVACRLKAAKFGAAGALGIALIFVCIKMMKNARVRLPDSSQFWSLLQDVKKVLFHINRFTASLRQIAPLGVSTYGVPFQHNVKQIKHGDEHNAKETVLDYVADVPAKRPDAVLLSEDEIRDSFEASNSITPERELHDAIDRMDMDGIDRDDIASLIRKKNVAREDFIVLKSLLCQRIVTCEDLENLVLYMSVEKDFISSREGIRQAMTRVRGVRVTVISTPSETEAVLNPVDCNEDCSVLRIGGTYPVTIILEKTDGGRIKMTFIDSSGTFIGAKGSHIKYIIRWFRYGRYMRSRL